MSIMQGNENREFPKDCNCNSQFGLLQRESGLCLCQEVHVTANNETKNLNVFRFAGSVLIKNQWAEITEVTNTTNMTNVYADVWDGTTSINLTDPGAIFSGMQVDSFFSKLKLSTEQFVLHNSNQIRMTEDRIEDLATPFLVTAKTGVDNYIRFNFTTNTVLDFKMKVFFNYVLINGSSLNFV